MNILVNDSGRACITDFGLSLIRADKTLAYTLAANTVLGCSYRWAAPELLNENFRPTRASDIWAFGCVCYEVSVHLFTGDYNYSSSTRTDPYRNGAIPRML